MKKFKINKDIGFVCVIFTATLLIISMCIIAHITNVRIIKNDFIDYQEHEVLSCIQYVSINVDECGDILNEDICYAFTYKEDGDELLHVAEYTEDECNRICIGKENKFVMYDNGDTKLYLTREVLSEFFYTKITEFEYE